ncbi:hypothetical protein [Novosphingobium sp. PP1Y]|uniref:hypothetical protein n=1 Tax=Novosphingobium sp. PP1Y TaxID=702113 RepID=UPI001314E0A5|nr:hypothetical protein [Novosphingobium sp. PP1Y]
MLVGHRREIARKESGLRAPAGIPLSFELQTLHAFDQVARKIDTSIALGSRVVSTEPDKRCFGRNRKRDLDVRKQDLIGDSGHGRHENKNRTNSQPVPYGPMRIYAVSDPDFERLGD